MDHYHPAAAEVSIWLLISLTCPSPTTSTISVASAIKDLISARAESSSIATFRPCGWIRLALKVESMYADEVWLKSNQGKLPDPYSSVDDGGKILLNIMTWID
jgi:hypothetical protein